MNVSEIIIKYLKDNGYDGLFNPHQECGCSVDDLAPCDHIDGDCCPAYKVECKTCTNNGDCETQREWGLDETDHCFYMDKKLPEEETKEVN